MKEKKKKKVSEMSRNHSGCCGALQQHTGGPAHSCLVLMLGLATLSKCRTGVVKGSQYLFLVCLCANPFA